MGSGTVSHTRTVEAKERQLFCQEIRVQRSITRQGGRGWGKGVELTWTGWVASRGKAVWLGGGVDPQGEADAKGMHQTSNTK